MARSLPGLLLLATIVDDAIFGGAIVASRVAFGTTGLVVASLGFVAISVAMAGATAWSLRTEPIRLSPKNRRRITALRDRRLGRFLIPHPDRPVTTAIAAIIFGSVAPLIVAALEPGTGRTFTSGMVVLGGVAYGVVFAAGYGLFGAIVGAAT
jgi:hypothetical protein